MNPDLERALRAEAQEGGAAYVRNLAEAEAAVLRGQFNLAKVFRAAAHTQRALALLAARFLTNGEDAATALQTILTETQGGETAAPTPLTSARFDSDSDAIIGRMNRVRGRLREIIGRALAGLEGRRDVPESAIPEILWGCYGCGYLAETARPDSCPVCGALGVEFAWFGPFYVESPEHLGQRTPPEICAILEATPVHLTELLAGTSDDALRRKTHADEWSVKEIVGHLIETDGLFRFRVRLITGEPEATIPRRADGPPWLLHEGKGYEDLPADELLERFRQTRAETLTLVRRLTPEDWIKKEAFPRGIASVVDLGTWIANHDLGHMAQIRYLCASGTSNDAAALNVA